MCVHTHNTHTWEKHTDTQALAAQGKLWSRHTSTPGHDADRATRRMRSPTTLCDQNRGGAPTCGRAAFDGAVA